MSLPPTFVLVHGSWHGAWCWYKVVARLERAGRRAIAVDLASLGRDRTPLADVTLDLWTRNVCDVIDAVDGPVVLVGHSRGGLVVSQAAERRPPRVAALVYVAAFLLRDGETLLATAEQDHASLILPNLVVADDGRSATIREEAVRAVFYGECADEDVVLARSLLAPEAMAPARTPISISDAAYGSVPRVYVECARDRAVTLALQRRMQAALPCRRVVTLDTDHSPFFSTPDALVAALLAASEDVHA